MRKPKLLTPWTWSGTSPDPSAPSPSRSPAPEPQQSTPPLCNAHGASLWSLTAATLLRTPTLPTPRTCTGVNELPVDELIPNEPAKPQQSTVPPTISAHDESVPAPVTAATLPKTPTLPTPCTFTGTNCPAIELLPSSPLVFEPQQRTVLVANNAHGVSPLPADITLTPLKTPLLCKPCTFTGANALVFESVPNSPTAVGAPADHGLGGLQSAGETVAGGDHDDSVQQADVADAMDLDRHQRSRGGSVTEFPVSAVAPAIDRLRGQQRTRKAVTGSDGRDSAQQADIADAVNVHRDQRLDDRVVA